MLLHVSAACHHAMRIYCRYTVSPPRILSSICVGADPDIARAQAVILHKQRTMCLGTEEPYGMHSPMPIDVAVYSYQSAGECGESLSWECQNVQDAQHFGNVLDRCPSRLALARTALSKSIQCHLSLNNRDTRSSHTIALSNSRCSWISPSKSKPSLHREGSLNVSLSRSATASSA